MNSTTLSNPSRIEPRSAAPAAWRRTFLTLATLGVAWNIFGIVQLFGTLTGTPGSLMASGMTAEQAAAYLALPGWMNVAFALGVFGGLAGSVALALRRRVARPVLAVSMAAYVALFAGDAHHGLFEIMPRQLPVLLVVLAVAAVLLVAGVAARRSGWLR